LCSLSIAAAQARREIRVAGLPEYRTLKCDFHMHTVFSDGLVWPSARVDEAWQDGLDAIAITDHIEERPHKDIISGSQNRPYEIAAGRAKDFGVLLVRGAEVTRETPPGHHNAIFLKDVDPLDTKDFFEVFRRANEQQAFVFWNHPRWPGPERGRWDEAQTKLYEKKWLHGIEICNHEEYFPEAHQWAVAKNLTIVGDTDMHEPMPTGTWTPEEHRTLTFVYAKDKTLESLHEALLAGRTVVWYRNQLFGKEQFLSAVFKRNVEVRRAYRRSNDVIVLEIHNDSDMSIVLEKAGNVGLDTVTLPPHTASRHKFPIPADGPRELLYRVANFLTAPKKPLDVKLTIPQ
jgi:hypothetical protein